MKHKVTITARERLVTTGRLSATAYDKVPRGTRTIADLEESDAVQSHHIGEAIQHRLLEREM